MIGSAQAAPSKKVFDRRSPSDGRDATTTGRNTHVHVEERRDENQTLGSANFTAPQESRRDYVGTPDRTTWSARQRVEGTSSCGTRRHAQDGAKFVSADVTVAIDPSECTDGDLEGRGEAVERLQRQPGQRHSQLNLSASNLFRSGASRLPDIGTPNGDRFADQIYVERREDGHGTATAFELCGEADKPLRHECTRGASATLRSLGARRHSGAAEWATGLPTAIALPAGTATDEAGRRRDRRHSRCHGLVSGISDPSDDFDVVETICTAGTADHWRSGRTTRSTSTPPLRPPERASESALVPYRAFVRHRDGATRAARDLHQSTRLRRG